METPLSNTHQLIYDAVFQHPIARNLAWHDVVAMLGALSGTALDEHHGTLKITRNGHTLVMHQPDRKNITDVREVMDLRRFLEQTTAAQPLVPAAGLHMLVVIDHRLARIYQTELHGAAPRRIVPFDPLGTARHLRHVEEDGSGQRKPEVKSFYRDIARTLEGAQQVLLFGTGTGASSAMEQLIDELGRDYPAVAGRVVGHVAIDEGHLTEDQLLDHARRFYEGLAAKQGMK